MHSRTETEFRETLTLVAGFEPGLGLSGPELWSEELVPILNRNNPLRLDQNPQKSFKRSKKVKLNEPLLSSDLNRLGILFGDELKSYPVRSGSTKVLSVAL